MRVYDTVREWVRQGHQVEVVTGFPHHPFGRLYPGYEAEWYRFEEIDGIGVHRYRTYVTANRGIVRRTLGHISFLPGALLAGERLREPELCIATSPPFFAATAAARMARQRRLPFVLEVRDLWPGIFAQLGVLKNGFLLNLLERWELALYGRADRIVSVTRSFTRDISRRGISPDKIDTIPNGADLDFWTPTDEGVEMREPLGLDDRFIVLYVGTLGLAQGLTQLLDAARLLENQPEIAFLLVGEGADKNRLRYEIERRNQRNVTILDAVDHSEVRKFYSMADVCAVTLADAPLLSQFIPSKLFEIMAMERPIVACLRGEAARIIEESGAGLVAAPGSPREIGAAIRQVQKQPDLKRKLGRAGRIFVEAHHSRPVLARRYLHILEEVLIRSRIEHQ